MTLKWVQEIRKDGQAGFSKTGLPAQSKDYWRATPLSGAVKQFPSEVSRLDVSYTGSDSLSYYSFPDIYDGKCQSPPWLQGLQSKKSKGELWDLCNWHLKDGIAVNVPQNHLESQPLEVTMTGHDGQFIVPRTAIRLEKGSCLTLIEHHQGQGNYWINRLSQIIIEEGATLNHIRLQDYSNGSTYTQITDVEVKGSGTYNAFNFITGAHLSRKDLRVHLNGQGAQANIGGLSLLRGNQLSDHTIAINHNAPNCKSSQSVGFILKDNSKGVFQGKVDVDRVAQKTDANQISRAVLLSDKAQMYTMPELEILADDVECAHGSTCGELDDKGLFYLRSRGIGEDEARKLMLEGFASQFLNEIKDEEIRSKIHNKATAWLSR